MPRTQFRKFAIDFSRRRRPRVVDGNGTHTRENHKTIFLFLSFTLRATANILILRIHLLRSYVLYQSAVERVEEIRPVKCACQSPSVSQYKFSLAWPCGYLYVLLMMDSRPGIPSSSYHSRAPIHTGSHDIIIIIIHGCAKKQQQQEHHQKTHTTITRMKIRETRNPWYYFAYAMYWTSVNSTSHREFTHWQKLTKHGRRLKYLAHICPVPDSQSLAAKHHVFPTTVSLFRPLA